MAFLEAQRADATRIGRPLPPPNTLAPAPRQYGVMPESSSDKVKRGINTGADLASDLASMVPVAQVARSVKHMGQRYGEGASAGELAPEAMLTAAMLALPGGGLRTAAKVARPAASAAKSSLQRALSNEWGAFGPLPSSPKAPPPHTKFIGLNRAELTAQLDAARGQDLRDLESIFGPEGAKRYLKLDRTANNSMDLARAAKASDELEAMQATLSQEQKHLLFQTEGFEQVELSELARATTAEEAADMPTNELVETFARILGGNGTEHYGNQLTIGNIARELRTRGADPTKTMGNYYIQNLRMSPEDAAVAARASADKLRPFLEAPPNSPKTLRP